jgi:hypothetical protein
MYKISIKTGGKSLVPRFLAPFHSPVEAQFSVILLNPAQMLFKNTLITLVVAALAIASPPNVSPFIS